MVALFSCFFGISMIHDIITSNKLGTSGNVGNLGIISFSGLPWSSGHPSFKLSIVDWHQDLQRQHESMNRMDKLSLFNLVSSSWGGVLGLISFISDLFIAALGTFSKQRLQVFLASRWQSMALVMALVIEV